MRIRQLHPWDVTPKEALQLQKELSHRVLREDHIGEVTKVAGVDVGFEDGNTVTRAAVAVLSFPGLELLERSIARLPTTFPYIPGLLSFREIPAILAALEGLGSPPDLVLCDGQGLAHPRRFGLACHLGVLSDLPTIGVAKTRYIGEAQEPGTEKGSWQPLRHRDEIVGAVLRTRPRTKPVYVSIGHRLCLETALSFTLGCTPRYRLPDTTRWAHRLASGPDPESATSPTIPR